MIRVVPFVLLTALFAVACSSTTPESDVLVDPAVLDVLEEASEVEVLVSLKPPDVPAEHRTMEIRSKDFAERWARVMDALGDGDFEVRIEYDQAAAVSGTLTRDGLVVLSEHSDVEGVSLSARGREVTEAAPAIGTLTGTISRLVEQIFEGQVVVEEITEPVTNGTVSIPELGVEQPLGPDGSFSFRRLEFSRDHMLVSVEVEAEGFRPTTWANYLVLSAGTGPNFTPRIEFGDEPYLIDPCPDLLATPPLELSAAQGGHARLCAELAGLVERVVYEALEQEEWVEVFVSLRQPDFSSEERTEQLLKYVAAIQAEVLLALSEQEFVVTIRPETSASLTGRVSPRGIDKLVAHEAVVGVVLDCCLTLD